MSMPRFEGSFLGDTTRIGPDAVLECKICWHVYDPALGCEDWQIPAGTSFSALPDYWRCPKCDGARDQFMVIDPGHTAAPAPSVERRDTRLRNTAQDIAQRLEAAFREIHVGQMRGAPLLNETLDVKALGFRPHGDNVLGILITPWFMNLVLAPGPDQDWSQLAFGTRELIEFPSGRYEFVSANRPSTGAYKACSLFSPMFDFTSMLQASEIALAALAALFDPAIHEEETRAADHPAVSAQGPQDQNVLSAQAGAGAPTARSRRELIFGSVRAGREGSDEGAARETRLS